MSIQFVVKRNDTCVSDQNEFAQLAGTFARKAASAAQRWSWYWLFPSCTRYQDEASERYRAHYVQGTVLQRCGIRDASTTMLSTLVLNKGGLGVRSPLNVEVPARLGCALRSGAVPPGGGGGGGGTGRRL